MKDKHSFNASDALRNQFMEGTSTRFQQKVALSEINVSRYINWVFINIVFKFVSIN